MMPETKTPYITLVPQLGAPTLPEPPPLPMGEIVERPVRGERLWLGPTAGEFALGPKNA